MGQGCWQGAPWCSLAVTHARLHLALVADSTENERSTPLPAVNLASRGCFDAKDAPDYSVRELGFQFLYAQQRQEHACRSLGIEHSLQASLKTNLF